LGLEVLAWRDFAVRQKNRMSCAGNWIGVANTVSGMSGNHFSIFKRLMSDQRGMETVEFAILAAMMVVGLVGLVMGIGLNILRKFVGLQVGTTHP
jgi:Flp pilus assembly pilin Flp